MPINNPKNTGASRFYLLPVLMLCLMFPSIGHAQLLTPARYEIDLKRKDLGRDYSSPEALLRAREFIRLDPTYYVGYLYEGFFRVERASDAMGFRQAIPSLKKALELFEKDHQHVLKETYTTSANVAANEAKMLDYAFLTDRLMDCYSNLEHPDSVIMLLNHYKSWDFQYDYLGADNYIAWTYHRNRFYTSDKFPFLRNSLAENEQTALQYLKGNLAKIEANAYANEEIMPYHMVLASKMSVYHYLAIVYSYLRKPDSAKMYYEFMEPYNSFPYNNYAIFCYVNGSFGEANHFFDYAQRIEHGDRRLREPLYYLTILNTMRANPQKSVTSMTQFIRDYGVRPGWGWYNIGLGRALLYNGQLKESMECLDKASRFREIHMGTTLGESHYNFSYQILKLVNLDQQIAAMRFEDKYYWLSPGKLKRLAELRLEQYSARVMLFNQLSSNVERQDLYYRLFSSEGTISFDEIFYLVKDYGRAFFIKNFAQQAQTDERENIRKYFTLLQAKLNIEKGNTAEALKLLKNLLETASYEKGQEQLYLARMYEALTVSSEASGTKKDVELFRNQFYATFPQLVPFSDVRMEFRLNVQSMDNPTSGSIVSKLKSYSIDFTKNEAREVPRVNLQFSNNGTKNTVTYSVESAWGKVIVAPKTIIYDDPSAVAQQLAYGIFNVGAEGSDVDDEWDY